MLQWPHECFNGFNTSDEATSIELHWNMRGAIVALVTRLQNRGGFAKPTATAQCMASSKLCFVLVEKEPTSAIIPCVPENETFLFLWEPGFHQVSRKKSKDFFQGLTFRTYGQVPFPFYWNLKDSTLLSLINVGLQINVGSGKISKPNKRRVWN